MLDNLGIVDTKKIMTGIQEAFGYDISDFTLTTIRRRIISVMSQYNISSADEFVEKMKRNNIDFQDLLDKLMIDTTELFRDPSLWRELKERYLPEISRSPGSKIWMAGISSGEELFSLMIVLNEAGLQDAVRVVASCPSKLRIEQIKKGGGYDLKKMELGDGNYTRFSSKFQFNNYYKIVDNKVYLDPTLLKGVEFDTFDLSQEKPTKTYRMIIFRNIMIQYNLPLYEKVTRKLIDSMTVGGYLLLGNMETLEHSEVGKKMQLINDVEKIYRKRID